MAQGPTFWFWVGAGGNVVVTVDTPGRITWTGSSVTLAQNQVVTGGVITWSGSTAITLVHGIGALSGGAITWTGSSVPLKMTIIPTAGVITWTGSSIVLKLGVGVTAGIITWSGSTSITLATSGGTTITVDTPGVITWTGSSVVLAQKQVVTAGVITWTGSSVTLKYGIPVSPGIITWTGQSVTLAYKIIPTAGVITWSGSTAITILAGGNVVVSVTSAGIITWTGAVVTVAVSGQGGPVKGPTRKLVLSGAHTEAGLTMPGGIFGDPDIAFGSLVFDFAGNFLGVVRPSEADTLDEGQNETDIQVDGSPRAVPIGSGRNSLVEV